MLAVIQDVVFFQMFQGIADNDVFEQLTAYTSKRDWSVVSRVLACSFLIYSRHTCMSPISRCCAFLQ
ncbi:hypothetical protein DPMN_163499 [Dreissena polymorpha]|uniref:Uncharacterized protein n=1 Tax=Dreissena polymorpha TaxID=45954 RepID=A0A9D4EVW4_DREPO|nr:hypothetical protein DPMN_163499 [Dreissena polymorpha]